VADRKTAFEDFVTTDPIGTILSDNAMGDASTDDAFNLVGKLGAAFDVLRHRNTRTPLTVGIYGSWGAGKTSAMRWLEAGARRWTSIGRTPKLRTAWFNPWKYQTQEDVWRGLVAEVILASVRVEEASVARVAKAAKLFGGALGSGFVQALGAVASSATGGLVDGDVAVAAGKDVALAARPEKPFLNLFESTLREWVEDTIPEDERLILFIDDLDRCLPEVTLEVLEALKLYLDIPRLIFVVGVDDEVVRAVVQKQYEAQGVDAEKSRKYLEKMFQVEVRLAPTEQDIEGYLDDLLARAEWWQYLGEERVKTAFRKVILELAERNPREVKRLINSAFVQGVSSVHLAKATDASLTVPQAVQLFLLRRALRRPNVNRATMLEFRRGQRFFAAWSGAVAEDPGGPLRPERSTEEQVQSKRMMKAPHNPAWEAGERWHDVLGPEHAAFHALLDDPILAELMVVGFPYDWAESKATTEPRFDDEFIEAVARSLGISAEEAKDTDGSGVEELDLSGTDISTLEQVARCRHLARLKARDTGVHDLRPLQGLTALGELDLSGSLVTDLSPLRTFESLAWLSVRGTAISTLAPLAGHPRLTWLYSADTRVTSIDVVAELPDLGVLDLGRCPIQSFEALRRCTGLEALFVGSTSFRDGAILAGLTRMWELSLDRSDFSEWDVLAALAELRHLDVSGCSIGDLAPLSGLQHLERLRIGGTQVRDLSPLAASRLQSLDLTGTSVDRLDAVTTMESLQVLNGSHTALRDLSHLAGHPSLHTLALAGVPATDYAAVAEIPCLRNLAVRSDADLPALPDRVRVVRRS